MELIRSLSVFLVLFVSCTCVFMPCSEHPKLSILDCRNRGLDDQMALEIAYIYRNYDTILMQNNFITCLPYSRGRAVILENYLNCSCPFGRNVVHNCRLTTESPDLDTTAPVPNVIYNKKDENSIIPVINQKTPKENKQKLTTAPSKIATSTKEQKLTSLSTHYRITTAKMITAINASAQPEGPMLPSYQAKNCSIWHSSQTYVLMAGCFILGIFATFCIACIRLRFFGKYISYL